MKNTFVNPSFVQAVANRVAETYRQGGSVKSCIGRCSEHLETASAVAKELGRRGGIVSARRRRLQKELEATRAQELHQWKEERALRGAIHAMRQRRDHLLPDP